MPKLTPILFALVLLCGCSTTARFVLPPGTQLEVAGRAVVPDAEGMVTTRPFFWNMTNGIPYRVLDGNTVVSEGRLKSGFRIVSIFWPPYAVIYWPMGFRESAYDLVNGTGGG